MTDNKKVEDNRLTLMVFRDNLATRTFSLPLNWLARFSILLSLLVVVVIVSVYAAHRFYRAAQNSGAGKIAELERQISDLKGALEAGKSGAEPLSVTTPCPVSSEAIQTTPSETSTPIAAKSEWTGVPYMFVVLPPESQKIVEPAQVPIMIQNFKSFWKNKAYHFSFNILYQQEDKGNQQGRIVVLARGPEALYAYPQGVLNAAGKSSLVAPEKGEYFSVSRFRETNAEFVGVKDPSLIKTVEVFLFNSERQVLIYQKLDATAIFKNYSSFMPAPSVSASPSPSALPSPLPDTPAGGVRP